jgi:hypothetical protein
LYKDYELNDLDQDEVRIKSRFGSVKHGTTFVGTSGESPFATMRFDDKMRMFIKKDPSAHDSIKLGVIFDL